MHPLNQGLHLLGHSHHLLSMPSVRYGLLRVAPGVEYELRVAVIGDHAGEAFAAYEIAERLCLRLGESARADIGLVARHVAGGGYIEDAPHVAIVAVRVDAERAVVVPPAVLAPKPLLRPAVFMAVRVDHRGDPDFAARQPASDRRL